MSVLYAIAINPFTQLAVSVAPDQFAVEALLITLHDIAQLMLPVKMNNNCVIKKINHGNNFLYEYIIEYRIVAN